MSSERSRRFVGPLTLGLVLLLALAGCGRKGDPQPPPRKNPERVRDLEVRQSGQELILSMSYPTMTTGGLALPGITRLEIVQYTRPAPEFMEQPEMELPEGELPEGEGLEGEGTGELEPTTELVDTEPLEPGPVESEQDVEVSDIDPQAPAEGEPAQEPEAEGQAAEGDEAMEGDEVAEGEPDEDEEDENPFRRIRIDTKEFDKQAETVVELEGTELEAAVIGGRIEVRLPLEEIATEPPVAYAFAVTTFAGRLPSQQSRPEAFVPLPPPPSPTDLTTTASGQGIALSWTGVEDAVAEESEPVGEETADEESEPGIEGYRVLRRLVESPGYDDALTITEPGVTEYLDATASYGRTYVYTVTAMLMETPLVESAPAEEQEVVHRDVYAPRKPEGLVVLAEAGRIRLLWDAGRARDIAGYLVFASVDGGPRQQLTPEPVAANEFVHQGTVSGTTYTYVVQVIDTSGNLSAPSEPVTTRAP